MTTAQANSLLSVEGKFCEIDMRLGTLARHVAHTGVEGADLTERRVRFARRLLRKALWHLSAGITQAITVTDDDDDLPL